MSIARCFIYALSLPFAICAAPKPHIVYILIDDWGWSNWGTHRVNDSLPEIDTPNLDALAADGVLLDRFYTHKFCGPSRAALQSGRLPIHVTVVDSNLADTNPEDPVGGFQGVPRNMTGIANVLGRAGYATHMAGVGGRDLLVQYSLLPASTPITHMLYVLPTQKWHCGVATHDHSPHGRGYDSALHYFDAANDHWTQNWGSCPVGNEQGVCVCMCVYPIPSLALPPRPPSTLCSPWRSRRDGSLEHSPWRAARRVWRCRYQQQLPVFSVKPGAGLHLGGRHSCAAYALCHWSAQRVAAALSLLGAPLCARALRSPSCRPRSVRRSGRPGAWLG
jgi:hypothetical protein